MKYFSWCFYSLREFLQSKPNKTKQKRKIRCSHKNLFKPGNLLVIISKPEKKESSVAPLSFATDRHVSVEGFCNLMICPMAHKRPWSWVR